MSSLITTKRSQSRAVFGVGGLQSAQEGLAEAARFQDLLGSETCQCRVFRRHQSNLARHPSFSWAAQRFLNFLRSQSIDDADAQGFEQPVHRFQAEAAAEVQKIGEMPLRKTGGASQAAAGQLAPADAGANVSRSWSCRFRKVILELFLEAIHVL